MNAMADIEHTSNDMIIGESNQVKGDEIYVVNVKNQKTRNEVD